MKYIYNNLKTLLLMMYDFIVVLVAFYLSIAIRLGDLRIFKTIDSSIIFTSILIISICQLFLFTLSGLYRPIVRFSSTPDLVRIIRGSLISIPISFTLAFLITRLEGIPRSTIFIDWLLVLVGLGGGRFTYRILKDASLERASDLGDDKKVRVLIIGAGVAAENLLRDIQTSQNINFKVIGFLDDDQSRLNRTIRGISILGKTEQINEIVRKYEIQKVIFANPNMTSEQLRKATDRLLDIAIDIKIIPDLSDILEGNLSIIEKLRNIEPEDLLGRKAVNLDLAPMISMISSKTVLVTGAGGSIGSELCYQIAKFNPKSLVLFELTELFLFELERSISSSFPDLILIPILGDIRNKSQLDFIFNRFKPQIVFHAAAYKHVPMIEMNPMEAIKTNVIGTENMVEVSSKYHIERFVLISTDKAINPTNIMGATKRIAELICQNCQKQSQTKFMTVRFGNVLGSSGSVIPIFKKQIENGGPVTVTDPEVKRYFMSIPEATQLVIQAGSLGNGGEIFVLNMGEPIRILDLAKEMISLAGFLPEKDIKIEFTGLRPGEKLFEELFLESEKMLKTSNSLVNIALTSGVDESFSEKLIYLKNLKEDSHFTIILSAIQDLVKEFSSNQAKEASTSLLTH
jgi:FlaA1/EpsC-like NDP-sugar epimerase